MLSDLAGAGVSELQGLKGGCELPEGHPIWSFPLSPSPFHLSGTQRLPGLGKGKVKPVRQGSRGGESKGETVAETKPVFVGFPSCLGGRSQTTAFLRWTESVYSSFSTP